MTKPRAAKPKRNEAALVRAILARLALDHDVECLRINAGGIATQGRYVKLAPAGVSDLLLCVRCRVPQSELSGDGTHIVHTHCTVGRYCALEAKVGKNKPTAKQLAWLERVRDLGGYAATVWSVEDALAEVEQCKDTSAAATP